MKVPRWLGALALGALIIVATTAEDGCSAQQQSHERAIDKAQKRSAYVQQNDVEFNNYDRRQKLADDPTAIIWCTGAFPIPSSPLFTVPIVGKITSGGKRPYDSDPGPDGMYGASGEYRYGFTPGGIYADWTNMSLFCTNEPTVWQREKTNIVSAVDPALIEAQRAAQDALKNNKPDDAKRILQDAINKIGGVR